METLVFIWVWHGNQHGVVVDLVEVLDLEVDMKTLIFIWVWHEHQYVIVVNLVRVWVCKFT